MPNKKSNALLGQMPLWNIARRQVGRLDLLTIDPNHDGGFLPVFSFEEEAETFLRLLGDEGRGEWCSRETTAGELVSVLLAPCAHVQRVALDPLPLSLLSTVSLSLVSISKDRFVEELLMEEDAEVFRGGENAQ